jgi:hypothetical protein
MRTAAGVNIVQGPDGVWHVGCTCPPRFAPDAERGVRAPWCLVLRAEADAVLALCPSCAAYVAFCVARYAPN